MVLSSILADVLDSELDDWNQMDFVKPENVWCDV